jgi:hypothetical protein
METRKYDRYKKLNKTIRTRETHKQRKQNRLEMTNGQKRAIWSEEQVEGSCTRR